MTDINTTIPLFDGMIASIHGIMNFVQVFVGGIFGLYLILVILKWKESRQLKKLMTQLHKDMNILNINLAKITGTKDAEIAKFKEKEPIKTRVKGITKKVKNVLQKKKK